MTEQLFEITTEPIVIGDVIQKVVHPHAGAINTFTGTVRELTRGKRTLYLTYEAYTPMALKQFQLIGKEVTMKWENARIAISHRIGELHISDVAVCIAVSTPHRAASYAASRHAIERIKQIVPIWKKEHGADGEVWIGNQQGTESYDKGFPEV